MAFRFLVLLKHVAFRNKIELECRASYKTLLTGVDKFPIPKNKIQNTKKNIIKCMYNT